MQQEYNSEEELKRIKWLALAKIKEGASLNLVKNLFIYEVERKGIYANDSMWIYLAKSTPSYCFSPPFLEGFKTESFSYSALEQVATILNP